MARDALDYIAFIAIIMLVTGILMLMQEASPTGQAMSTIKQTIKTYPPVTSFSHGQCGPDPLHYCFEGWGADPDGNNILYASWHWGDGANTRTTRTNVEHSFPGPGQYTVTLRTVDSGYETGVHKEKVIIA